MLSSARASGSSDTWADCPDVSHKKHCNAMPFSVLLGVSDTWAGCPGRVSWPTQSGLFVAEPGSLAGCPARMPGSCVAGYSLHKVNTDHVWIAIHCLLILRFHPFMAHLKHRLPPMIKIQQ